MGEPENPTTPESRLAAHWRESSGGGPSDFDALVSGGREKLDIAGAARMNRSIRDVAGDIAVLMERGHPLSYAEYHLAVAVGLCHGGSQAYEQFFEIAWHETRTHRDYCPAGSCARCRDEHRAGKGRRNRSER